MGYQLLWDFGIPQVITAQVATSVAAVSGGEIAFLVSGTSSAVSSGLSSFISSDLQVASPASGTNFPIGVVVQNAVSGTYVGVLTRGVVILPASTGITAGDPVCATNGANAVDVITSGTNAAQLADVKQRVGRALTSVASGTSNYVLVNVGAI